MHRGNQAHNGVLVTRADGQRTKDLLRSLGILDGTKKVAREGDDLIFPVNNSRLDLGAVPGLEGATYVTRSFQERRSSPRCIREVLGKLLTDGELAAIGTSYDVVGDVAIIEIPPDLLDRRFKIGSAIIGWLPVRTVAMKSSPTAGNRRLRGLEVIAGDPSLETTHRENGLSYRLDLSRVFFNPRLGGERARIAVASASSRMVIDMFAGVGTFSIPVCRGLSDRRGRVFAIDLNEDAYEYLLQNARLNRAWGLTALLGDSRDLAPRIASEHGRADRIIMNLPKSSREFLPAAARSLKPGGWLHYYRLAEKDGHDVKIRGELASVGDFHVERLHVVESYSPSRSIYVADAQLLRQP